MKYCSLILLTGWVIKATQRATDSQWIVWIKPWASAGWIMNIVDRNRSISNSAYNFLAVNASGRHHKEIATIQSNPRLVEAYYSKPESLAGESKRKPQTQRYQCNISLQEYDHYTYERERCSILFNCVDSVKPLSIYLAMAQYNRQVTVSIMSQVKMACNNNMTDLTLR